MVTIGRKLTRRGSVVKSEKDAYRLLKEHFSGMFAVHHTRLENWAGTGVPDVNWCFSVQGEGVEVWTELKFMKGFQFRSELKAAQAIWLRNRWLAGGRAYLLAVQPPNTFLLWEGHKASRLRDADSPLNVPTDGVYTGEYAELALDMLNHQPPIVHRISIDSSADSKAETLFWVS